MSDLKFQACRKLVIIMLTDLGVRGGPSLSISLARAETFLRIDGHLHWCGPDSVGSLVALTWALGGSLVFSSCVRDVGLLLVSVAFPGCGVFAWLFLLVVPVCGCWVLFIRCFCVWADACFPLFYGRCCLFFVFSGGLFWLLVYSLLGFALLEINSYLSKKKKNIYFN